MLSVKQLFIKDRISGLVLIDNLSFSLQIGDKIAIIGSEGSGKSTLLKYLYNDDLDYVDTSGQVIRPHHIAYIEQNINTKWHAHSVEEYLSGNLGFSFYDYLPSAISNLMKFGLLYDEIADRKIETFSGGERMKIGLAKALMGEPDCLLLDEPSNDLDFEMIRFLEVFLTTTKVPTIFISHDQRLLENVCNGVIHLQQVYKKTKAKTFFLRIGYNEYKEKFIRKFESDLMMARKQRADYKKKLEKFRQIYQSVEHQQNQVVRDPVAGRLLKKRMHVLKSQESRYEKEKENFTEIPEREEPMNIFFDKETKINPQKNMLDLSMGSFVLRNGRVIENINLHIRGKDRVVIYGRNGVGKTNLIRYIQEMLLSNAIKVGYISQDYLEVLDENMSVVKFMMEKQDKYEEHKIRQILGTLGFKTEEMDYKISEISEGMKLKTLLLLMVSGNHEILLLDEPTRNISPINQDEIYELFSGFSGAIVAVTHDRKFIEAVFEDIYELTEEGLFKR